MSSDIEDRRGGGGGGFPIGGLGGGLGLGGTVILLLLSVVFGRDFLSMFSGAPAAGYSERAASRASGGAAADEAGQLISAILDDVQTTWDRVLPEDTGNPYRHAKLVLFEDYTSSACGAAQSATGPFYCPADQDVYIDLGFFHELGTRFGAPGEFAQAYVVAHEIGHHVQRLLGVEAQVRRLQRQNPSARNPLSVRLELQADCLAGVWANRSTGQHVKIEQSDIPVGMQAAASVGDDRLQRMSGGHVSPESFTHGSSAQRVQWFRTGLERGTVSSCDTFQSF